MAGIALLVLSVVAIASYNVLARRLLRDYRPLDITYMMLAVGCVSFVGISLAGHLAAGTVSTTVVSIAAGVLILNERIELYHVVGSVLIIAGVIGTARFGRAGAPLQPARGQIPGLVPPEAAPEHEHGQQE